MENSLENYYKKEIDQLRERYKQEGELFFLKSFESLVLSLVTTLKESKKGTEERISEVDKMNLRYSEKIIKMAKDLHNNLVKSSKGDVQYFIEECKPDGITVKAPDFKEFEIK